MVVNMQDAFECTDCEYSILEIIVLWNAEFDGSLGPSVDGIRFYNQSVVCSSALGQIQTVTSVYPGILQGEAGSR